LPCSLIGDTRDAIPAELDTVDGYEARAFVANLASAMDATELVAVALGEVDMRAVRVHPRPPPVDERSPLLVGVHRELSAVPSEQDLVRVVVPGEREQNVTLRADEVRLPVRRAELVESDDDVVVRSCPVNGEIDVPGPDYTRQLEHPERLSERTIGSLRDLHGSSSTAIDAADRTPVLATWTSPPKGDPCRSSRSFVVMAGARRIAVNALLDGAEHS
jgi:hypothetical protein